MALFALREGFRVETTPTGGRVIHVRTGDSLDLTFVEVQILARAAAGGMDTADPVLRPVVRKLASLGLLEKVTPSDAAELQQAPPHSASQAGLWVFSSPDVSPPPPAASPPEPAAPVEVEIAVEPAPTSIQSSDASDTSGEKAVEVNVEDISELPAAPTADELAPLFRSDLTLGRRAAGGLYDVADPVTLKTFAFYDFEISIARMLNGLRTYGQVIEAAHRLGIPASLESLAQFIRQLERYGFLAPPGASPTPVANSSVWPKRDRWEESIRQLFQSGIRLSRQARYYEAAAYFEAILEHDPDNEEATEMLEQVRFHLASAPAAVPLDEGVELILQLPASDGPPPAERAVDDSAKAEFDPFLESVAPPQAEEVDVLTELIEPATAPQPIIPMAEEPPATPANQLFALPSPMPPLAPPASQAALAPEPSPEPPLAPTPITAPVTATAPTRERSSRLYWFALGGLLLCAGGAAGWWSLKSPVSLDAAAPMAALPADAAAEEPAALPDASPTGPDASEPVAAAEPAGGADASEPVAAAEPAGGADASEPVAPAEPAGADASIAARNAPSLEEGWFTASVSKRGRVNMGELKAQSAGMVTWTIAEQERVRKGQVVGKLKLADGTEQPLSAPMVGLLMPRVGSRAEVEAGVVLASFPYFEAYAKALVFAPSTPSPAWVCEVVDQSTDQRSPCKVTGVEARAKGFFITATVEPLWFDTATAPQLRLKPPP
ncbi:MAG: hypothetical protein HY901_03145 [Deltaproteobacteria bacterium]|nr:hypothetical protein [Deltaproteobacteria bacterium]